MKQSAYFFLKAGLLTLALSILTGCSENSGPPNLSGEDTGSSTEQPEDEGKDNKQ
jgi:hypothetical protein